MDRLTAFLELVRARSLAVGHFRGFCHVVIGRRVTTDTGELVSSGVTWRVLSALLRDLRYDKTLVIEVGADPDQLSPRDRQRYWYSAIALARPDSAEARDDAEALIPHLEIYGYLVGPPPAEPTVSLSSPVPPPAPTQPEPTQPEPPKKGRRRSR